MCPYKVLKRYFGVILIRLPANYTSSSLVTPADHVGVAAGGGPGWLGKREKERVKNIVAAIQT